jgi:hypothetical protein
MQTLTEDDLGHCALDISHSLRYDIYELLKSKIEYNSFWLVRDKLFWPLNGGDVMPNLITTAIEDYNIIYIYENFKI